MQSPQSILQWIQERKSPQKTLLVGIDGPGGTGKTTLANKLQSLDTSMSIVHMDHFDLPSNGKVIGDPMQKAIGEDTDWRRVLREVLIPLQKGGKSRYRPFDRETERFGMEQIISPGGIVLLEGVFAIRRELMPFFGLTLWLTCSLQTRLERALKRDGEAMRERWEKDWIPMEERYIQAHSPASYAHKVIDTEA